MSAGRTGGCACGGVRYRVTGATLPVTACHCETCRRTSGHYVAATACAREDLKLEAAGTLAWWESSEGHRRGFCNRCGSSLFWDRAGSPTISIWAGTLDGPTGLELTGHIFTAEKGDYYAIPADAPQAEGWPEPRREPTGESR